LKDRDTTNLVVDDGNTTVVMTASEYNNNMVSSQSDHTYRCLSADATVKIERKTIIPIKKCCLLEKITERQTPHSSSPLRLCRLPKMYKENCIDSPRNN
jgi:hypothetical protein